MVAQGDIDALHAGKERAMHAPGAPEDARAAAAARGLVRGGRNGRVEEPLIPGRP